MLHIPRGQEDETFQKLKITSFQSEEIWILERSYRDMCSRTKVQIRLNLKPAFKLLFESLTTQGPQDVRHVFQVEISE